MSEHLVRAAQTEGYLEDVADPSDASRRVRPAGRHQLQRPGNFQSN